jgi:hypothetical protein
LLHSRGPRNVAECLGDAGGGVGCFFEPGIKIGHRFLRRAQVLSGEGLDLLGFDQRDVLPRLGESACVASRVSPLILTSTVSYH